MKTSIAVETLHERLHRFLSFLKPRLTLEEAAVERISRMRALADLRVRSFAVGRPQVTAADLCTLLATPGTVQFDTLAVKQKLLSQAHLESPLELLGPTMGILMEICLFLPILGTAKMKAAIGEFVRKAGPVPDNASSCRPASAPPPLSPAIQKLLGGVEGFWSPPESVSRLLDLLEFPHTPPDKIAREIDRDPGLASMFHRLRATLGIASSDSGGKLITSADYPAVRRLLAPAGLLARLDSPPLAPSFDRKTFWEHALHVAHAARLIGRATGRGNPEAQFLAGLLHDLGRLAVARRHPSLYNALQPPLPREEQVLGTSHAEIGAVLAERWNLGRAVAEAARHHHAPPSVLEDLELTREAAVAITLCGLSQPGARVSDWIPFLGTGESRLAEIRFQAKRLAGESLHFFEAGPL